eukprot:CAMPEP_0176096840 /NCGR_PEP_ID=MMETSP0120_2-20121206/48547_1 /TAXON_ID=160619 /ORGANISM="Kryptoperidinium foliaceum, Strain CCMP 1326" /LENGTH=56 /DNA_ID=CAMNT_0017430827 /DNA_START=1 /DNA_END=167 /DNA_ORIENTATION=-
MAQLRRPAPRIRSSSVQASEPRLLSVLVFASCVESITTRGRPYHLGQRRKSARPQL